MLKSPPICICFGGAGGASGFLSGIALDTALVTAPAAPNAKPNKSSPGIASKTPPASSIPPLTSAAVDAALETLLASLSRPLPSSAKSAGARVLPPSCPNERGVWRDLAVWAVSSSAGIGCLSGILALVGVGAGSAALGAASAGCALGAGSAGWVAGLGSAGASSV